MVKVTSRKGIVSYTSSDFGRQALNAILLPQSIERPDQALSKLRNAINAGGLAYLVQGALLTEIRKRGWTCGADSFEDLCETILEIGAREARYLMQIFAWVAESGLDAEDLQDVGWCKVRTLSAFVAVDNAREWIEKAKCMTFSELEQAVRISRVEEGTRDQRRTKVFKLHEDQAELVDTAIRTAKSIAGTEYDSFALELICIEYVTNINENDDVHTPRDAMVNLLSLTDPDDAVVMLRDAHPDHPIFGETDAAA